MAKAHIADLGNFRDMARKAAHEVVFPGVFIEETGAPAASPFINRHLWFCFCVQDTPDNPCPCIWPPFLVSFLEEPVSVRETGQKSREGLPVQEVTVRADARVTIEMPIGMTAAALSAAVNGTQDCGCNGSPSPDLRGRILRAAAGAQ